MRFPFLVWAVLAACPSLCQFDHPVKEQSDHLVNKALYNGTYPGLVSYVTENSAMNRWQDHDMGEDMRTQPSASSSQGLALSPSGEDRSEPIHLAQAPRPRHQYRFTHAHTSFRDPSWTTNDTSVTRAPWRHGVFLGVQTTKSYNSFNYERSIHRHRWGHGFSIGFERVLFPPGDDPFNRYSLPFQATVFRGRVHCWEMGLGVLFTHAFEARDYSSAYNAGQINVRMRLADTMWATWQLIGYRYDRPHGRLTFRVCPELAMNIWEFNKDWFEYIDYGSTGQTRQWDLVPRLSIKLGWLFQ